ncbi:methylated-DNA--[protein]-cysteine S-methyltransferase [Alistipes sp.]|uniref:methylated-DNA--[protein]-cysteine S-methyltransferase n=1 Tax=Alistipes sp. TaxID=1872444 RepID=UPI003AB2AC62
MTYSMQLETPIGPLTVTATKKAVTAIRFGTQVPEGSTPCTGAEATPLLRKAAEEIGDYFAGSRRKFTLPLAPEGTPFQQKVWEALRTIPYGETRTYKQIAIQIGHNQSFRAVGMASNRNPIAIVVPCHRVIGYDGKLTGYAGGLDIKEQLLELEKR